MFFCVALLYSGWQSEKIKDTSESNIIGVSKVDIRKSEKESDTSVFVTDKEIERYGIIITNSTSGSLRLRYYDQDKKKTLDNFEGHPSFWASVQDSRDSEEASKLFDYVEKNKESVFKIEGTKDSDDCDFYGNGVCLENVTIKKIEAVAK